MKKEKMIEKIDYQSSLGIFGTNNKFISREAKWSAQF